MRPTRASALALLLLTGLLAGCSKNNNPANPLATGAGTTPSSDQALVTSAIAASPQAIEDGLADADFQTTLDSPTGVAAAIQPITYWRTITRRDRTFEFQFGDNDANGKPTTAFVTIHKLLVGQFNILVGTPDLGGEPPISDRAVIHKPLEDHWVRRVTLKRVRLEGDTGDPVWRIVAISGVKVTSKDATTNIMSLRIQAADLDTTIFDPLAFQRLRRVLRFDAGTKVLLTVTTGRNDDVVVLHHRDRRFRFHKNGDNTYTGAWTTGTGAPFPGLQHVGINALSHGTLFDDKAPYDSQSWIFPYSLEPESMMAEFLP
jgi:hypothetical protein